MSSNTSSNGKCPPIMTFIYSFYSSLLRKMGSARTAVLVLLVVAVPASIGWYYFRVVGNMFYQSSEYVFPKKVLTSKSSPSGRYIAKILYDEKTKNYFFAIQGSDGTQLILSETFIPSAGYHDPIVTVSWYDTDTAKIIVDRDFGEGNLVYEFNVQNLSFKRRGSNY